MSCKLRSIVKILMAVPLVVLGLTGCREATDEHMMLRLGHGHDTSHPVHGAMEFLAKDLSERSGGRIEVAIFPGEQLGPERVMIEQLQLGALDMVKASAGNLESFIPELSVFSLPYLFRDNAHAWEVLEGPIGRELLAAGNKVGLKGLCYYDAGSRSFYTMKAPILEPANLRGLKMRVMPSRSSMDMIEALGGHPVGVSWGELYTALQQGVVDGAENNPPSFVSARHHEIAKHYVLNEHTTIPDLIVMALKRWESFSPEDQALIQAAADASADYERELWARRTQEDLAEAEAAGVKVYRPDKEPFRQKVEPVYDGLTGEIGELAREIRGEH